MKIAFMDNKYTRTYFAIIKSRDSGRFKGDGYTYEEHHIIPKSLGGLDHADNLVLLTHKEHFICHLLLVKMCVGKDKKSMSWALHRMAFSGNRKLTSGAYSIARRLHVDNLSGNNHPSKTNENWTTNVSNAVKKHWVGNDKRRKDASDTRKKWISENPDKAKEIQLNASKLGAIASANKTRGTKRPNTGLGTHTNPRAKHITLIDPFGIHIECYGNCRKYCDSIKLCYTSLYKKRNHKGYIMIDNGYINERKEVSDNE